MANKQTLDLRCFLAPVSRLLGPKYVPNPEKKRSLRLIVFTFAGHIQWSENQTKAQEQTCWQGSEIRVGGEMGPVRLGGDESSVGGVPVLAPNQRVVFVVPVGLI